MKVTETGREICGVSSENPSFAVGFFSCQMPRLKTSSLVGDFRLAKNSNHERANSARH